MFKTSLIYKFAMDYYDVSRTCLTSGGCTSREMKISSEGVCVCEGDEIQLSNANVYDVPITDS